MLRERQENFACAVRCKSMLYALFRLNEEVPARAVVRLEQALRGYRDRWI